MKLSLVKEGGIVFWDGMAMEKTCRESGGCGCGGSREVCKTKPKVVSKPQTVTVVAIDRLDEHKNVLVLTKEKTKHWISNESLSLTTIADDTKTVEFFDLHDARRERVERQEVVSTATVEYIFDTIVPEHTRRA